MPATQHSMEISLRWTRRLIVIILIIANLMTVVLADAASATSASQLSFPNVRNQQGLSLFINDNRSTDRDDAWQTLPTQPAAKPEPTHVNRS